MIIQNNMMASNINRQLKITNKKLNKSGGKLSTGFSINSAADNAAGLTISEKMRGQIRGLNQASENIGDGLSYIQVADGALSEVQAILQRINELSVKAANDTYTGVDREAIDKEIQDLKVEINRIFTDTEFNTRKIWEDNPTSRVQIGTETLPAITISSNSTTGTLNEINKEAIPISNVYNLEADESGITISWKAYNGEEYKSSLIEWPDKLVGGHSFKLSDYIDTDTKPELAGLDFTYSYNVIEAATLDDVINSINGKSVSCSPSNSVGTTIYSDDGKNIPGISFTSSIRYEALLGSQKNFDTYDDLFIEGSIGKAINESNLITDPTVTSSSDRWVFEFEMPNIGTVKAISNSTYYYSSWKDPDKNWWGTNSNGNPYIKTYSPSPDDGSLDSVNNSLVNSGLDLLNDSGGVGGSIVVSFDLLADTEYELAGPTKYKNVGSMRMTLHINPYEDTIETIKEKLGNIRGIDIYAGNEATKAPSVTTYYARNYNQNGILIESPIYQSVIDLNIQSGANTDQNIKVRYKTLNNHSLGINNTNSLTREAAEKGITEVSNALATVSEQRSAFGAYQNRLEHAKANADNMSENTQKSESKIRDTDMAKEMVEFSKNQILQQATHSLLSQANAISEGVLTLLK